MTITPLDIPEVLLVEPVKHGDSRGFFSEVYRQDWLVKSGFHEDFIQDNHAYSAEAGVLRGLHYQAPPMAQDKLIRVIKGAIWDIDPSWDSQYVLTACADANARLFECTTGKYIARMPEKRR